MPRVTTDSTLVGRDDDRAVLLGLLDRAASGTASAALVEGEAGVGKSRLVADVASAARDRGFRVLMGGAEELEQARPFRAIAAALSGCRSDDRVKAIFRNLVDTSEGSEGALTEALGDLFEEFASETPLLLVLEDLHWADVATIVMARGFVGRLTGRPAALIATFRPSPRSRELDAAFERMMLEGAAHVGIAPLDGESVQELVRTAVGAEPGPGLIAQVARAAGNPLYVLELVNALRDEGAISVEDGRADAPDRSTPPSLRLTVLRRLGYLPEETRADLHSASVLGSSFSLNDLALITGRRATDVATRLRPALEARVLVEDGERIAFGHDLIRDAIYEDMPRAIRKAMHHDVGRAFAEAGRAPIDVALHMAEGADVGDREAISWLVRAARSTRSSSTRTIVTFLERAIALLPADDPERLGLEAETIGPLSDGGRSAEAEERARALLTRSLPFDVELLCRLRLGNAVRSQGRQEEAYNEWGWFQGADAAPQWMRQIAHVERAQSRFLLGDLDTAEREIERSLAIGTPAPIELGYAELVRSQVSMARGHIGDAVAAIGRSDAALGPFMETGEASVLLYLMHGMLLADTDRFDDAHAALIKGRVIAERLGLGHAAIHLWGNAFCHYLSGDWDDALAEAEAGEAAEDQFVPRLAPPAIRARIHLHRGNLADANAALEIAEAELADKGPGVGADLVLWVRALAIEAEGDVDGAADLLASLWAAAAPFRYFLGTWKLIAPDVRRLALATARTQLAEEVRSEAARGAELAGEVVSADAAAAVCDGRPAEAVEHLGTTSRLVERTNAREATGDVNELAEAIAVWERLGAERDAARVEAALRSGGVRRGRRGARPKAKTGWAALSKTELEVARLVADGLTNPAIGERLFISRRTVQTHVMHIFQKLGVSTRIDVARMYVEHGS